MDCLELKCCVCDQDYSDDQIPRNLRCGHSVCSTCVDMLIPISKKCPECREHFRERSASELPVNYPLLRLSRIIALEKIDPNNLPQPKFPISYSSSESKQEAGKCSAHGCSMFFMCMRCSVWVCRDCLVIDHPDPPRGRCFILSIDDAINKITKSHTSNINKYIDESNDIKINLDKQIKMLNATMKHYKNSGEENDSESIKVRNQLKKQTENLVSSLSTLDSVTKALKEAKEKFSNVSCPKDISKPMAESGECQSAFEKYKEKENEKENLNILNILLCGKKDLKEVVEGGKPVFVVTEREGKVSWASIIWRDEHLLLYSLRDGVLPEGGLHLPFDLVRELVPVNSPAVFLEVGWRGEVKGRTYIRMFGDTPRSRQTTFMCSGEKGPSYRNTRFYELAEESDGSILLRGGDYENNDGTGGCAIVPGIFSGGPHFHEAKAGLLVSWPSNELWRLCCFDIFLNDIPDSYDNSAHGMVEEGLDILKKAAEIKPITDTLVMDCGLVIPT